LLIPHKLKNKQGIRKASHRHTHSNNKIKKLQFKGMTTSVTSKLFFEEDSFSRKVRRYNKTGRDQGEQYKRAQKNSAN
ncbi:hypothetical protein, partial [Phocaeicola plebeius]|uniref:hypothetical protein n=1 Tax=Phocaeicola plebeius TaxID=310297 RepID=UPI003AEFE55F